MRSFASTVGALATILPLVLAGQAPATTGNTAPNLCAQLPANPYGATGNIQFGPGQGGNGATVQISLSNLPSSGGPFCKLVIIIATPTQY